MKEKISELANILYQLKWGVRPSDIPNDYATIQITGICEDIFGNEIKIRDDAKIENVIMSSAQLMERRESEQLRREISDLSKSVEPIFDEVGLNDVDALIKMENSKRVIESLKQNGPLTFDELIQRKGLNDIDLVQTLIWMNSADTIQFDQEEVFDLLDNPDTVIELTIDE